MRKSYDRILTEGNVDKVKGNLLEFNFANFEFNFAILQIQFCKLISCSHKVLYVRRPIL